MIKKVVDTWHGAVAGELSRIVKFLVIIRPLQPIDAVHEQMRAMVASMPPPLHPDERRESCCQ